MGQLMEYGKQGQPHILYKRDQEFARLEEQRQILMDNNAWTLEMEEQYNQARLNAQRTADGATVNLTRQTEMTRQQLISGSLSTISSLMSSKYQALFRIGQAAAIANAIISTNEGATKALGLGPIWGPPAALAIKIAGYANVATIASTKIGGGTPSPVNATFSGGSVGTGSDPSPITAPNAPAMFERAKTEFNFVLNGTAISMDTMVNEFIPKLEEAYNNGAGGGGAIFNITRG